MKTRSGLGIASSDIVGKESSFFFRVDSSFSLYFTSMTTIRIYFHALVNFYEVASLDIFFPFG